MTDALTKRERRIMQLWDQGMSVQRIANKMELPIKLVRQKVAVFHIGTECRAASIEMAIGSARLARAIARARLSNQPQQGDIHG